MRKFTLASISAAALLVLLATPSASTAITGITIDDGLACHVSDLSEESKSLSEESRDLIILWWTLNSKKDEGTLTEEEYRLGAALANSRQCGRMHGGVPVTIVQTDGTIYLGEWPDGELFGFTDGTVLLDREYR